MSQQTNITATEQFGEAVNSSHLPKATRTALGKVGAKAAKASAK